MLDRPGPATIAELRERAESLHSDLTLDKKNSRRIARNTLEFDLESGGKAVLYHHTQVVTITKSGSFTLNSGGWNTVTTKERMNAAMPEGCYIFANQDWYIQTPQGLYPYADGARFKADGTPINPQMLEDTKSSVSRDKQLVARFLRNAGKNGWHDPAGDPWIFSQPSRETMLEWLQEDYFTARLCVLALEQRFAPAGISIYMNDLQRKGGKPSSWIKTLLRRYIYKSLGIV